MRQLVSFKEDELMWLEMILGRGMDGFFEGNPYERIKADTTYIKVCKALNKCGYDFGIDFLEKNLKKTKKEFAKCVNTETEEEQ